jgi:hypothetical protein
MSSLVVLCLSSHYRIVLLPHYELVPLPVSVGYVQTILNDVARASPRLVPPPVSRVCHRSGPDLFLCCHKSMRRSRYGRQIRRCFCVAAGQGVHHHVSRAGSEHDAKIEADELAGPLVLRDCCKALVEEELQAEVIGLDEEWVPHRYGRECRTAWTSLMSSRS